MIFVGRPMTLDLLAKEIEKIDNALTLLFENKMRMPGFIVLYSAIDIMASLDNENPKAKNRQSYTSWLSKYLLAVGQFDCTADDLYGGRCGVVHTLTADSDLNANGKARQIIYAWGKGDAAKMQELVVRTNSQANFVCVQIEGLLQAWRDGTKNMLHELTADKPRAERILAKAARFFIDMDQDDPLLKKFGM